MTLFTDTLGHGPDLILIHGGPGLDHSYFRPWLDALSSSFRIHYFDLSGHGRSRPAEGSIGPARWIEDIGEVVHQAGPGPSYLLGHSFGGFLALEYVLAGGRVDHLILSNTGPALDYPELMMANAHQRRPELVPRLVEMLSNPAASDESFGAGMMAILPLYLEGDPAEATDLLRDVRFSADGYNAGAAFLGTYNVNARLGEITCPTTVISSTGDWITPKEMGGDRLAAGIAHARHVTMHGCGHFPWVEDADGFRAAVRSTLGR